MRAERTTYMGRDSVCLENDTVRTVIETAGGMMPEFSIKLPEQALNTHWIPVFREPSGRPYSADEDERFWKAKLLYLLAGDFPCSPNFGDGCVVDGVELPPHGWAANNEWRLDRFGTTGDAGLAWARFALPSPSAAMPLVWNKCDMLLDGHAAYYSVMRIRNTGSTPIAINLTRHNTLGEPFLQPGCRISLCADRYLVGPEGTEFDTTGRLLQGAEFSDLRSVPLRAGGTADVTVVPGMIGATDFVTGAVPAHVSLGWSCVVNPALGLAYICFFPGERALPEGEIALSFNDLWLQYGGRRFTPWAASEGGEDRTFCLGTENGTGAYANGLAYSRQHPELLGRPTTVTIPAGGERKLCYGTAIVRLSDELLREGVRSIEPENGSLVLKGEKSIQRVTLDATFERVRRYEADS